VVERIQFLLSRFPENEETVRRMVATDPRFDALCNDYRRVIDLIDRFEAEVERLFSILIETGAQKKICRAPRCRHGSIPKTCAR
jgi:hypothetical protein